MASEVRRRNNKKAIDLIVTELAGLGARGGTATQLQGLVGARGGVEVDRRSLLLFLRRAERHGDVVEISRGRFALSEACGCKPKKAKKKVVNRKKKCKKEEKRSLVKRLIKIIFKRDRRGCAKKPAPKKKCAKKPAPKKKCAKNPAPKKKCASKKRKECRCGLC